MRPEDALAANLQTASIVMVGVAVGFILSLRLITRTGLVRLVSALVITAIVGAVYCVLNSQSISRSTMYGQLGSRAMTASEELSYDLGLPADSTVPIVTTKQALLDEMTPANPRTYNVFFEQGHIVRTDSLVSLRLYNFTSGRDYQVSIPKSKLTIERVSKQPSVRLTFENLDVVRHDGSQIGTELKVSPCRYYWNGPFVKCRYISHEQTDYGTYSGPNSDVDTVELIQTHLVHATLRLTDSQL